MAHKSVVSDFRVKIIVQIHAPSNEVTLL
ncbi:hypothetical protein CCACVL1_05784 [Corchorus capsularis]|uniref:Uncharacterized protein n=1 Tax=Corchorus capsularis TaxID=210143 RepID=A0A1R3JJ30_COCAP|nr:hypothetical protein CCACVL1_05784 [Corchorus capsularis]